MMRLSSWVICAMVAVCTACGGGTASALLVDTADSGWPDVSVEEQTAQPEVAEVGADEVSFDLVPADVEFDLPPGPGDPGYPCEDNGDCTSGFCIPTVDGEVCTDVCFEECPFGWTCALHQGSLPDEIYICVPAADVLCKPCNLNTDCLAAGADVGGKCVSYLEYGHFCALTCSDSSPCFEPYKCLSGTDASGADVEACLLDEHPGCDYCPQAFADEGAWTACYAENEWGLCEGERVCTADGLTECDAPEPAEETCNGKDDDCDGDEDEELSGGTCTNANEFGLCEGEMLCLGGVEVCDGPDPEPEECDGMDNNCDGGTDEGFTDTDGDGTADCMENDKDDDGVVDGQDNCEFVFNPAQEDFDLDGDGDACDLDDDNDMTADEEDCAPFDDTVYPWADELCDGKDNDCDNVVDEGSDDTDADGFKDCIDEDDDNDDFVDEVDCAPLDALIYPGAMEACDGKDNDCDNQTDEGFPDNDGDGVADCLDDDSDGDGVPNDDDNCPADENPEQEDADGDGDGDVCDPDLDGDGVPNNLDNCAAIFSPSQTDSDGDGEGDACDDDLDGDGVENKDDNCPDDANPGQEDNEDDGVGDVCDPDDDDDGVDDDDDNCPVTPNPVQMDSDNDGVGDACEDDVDGDKVPDGQDNCPAEFNPQQEDCNGDGQGDACQDDDDGDGVADDADNCICLDNSEQEDLDEDGEGDACDSDLEGDGIANGLDNCPALFNPGQADQDGDGLGDLCDADADGDGVDDDEDNCVGLDNGGQEDLDQDGLGDACDDDADGDGDPNLTDCSSMDAAIHHGAEEQCDGIDNNCDAGVDEGFNDKDLDGLKDCVDMDDDGDGDPDLTDCAPWDPAVFHGAEEVCNGVDDDCNGPADDGLGFTTCGQGICVHTVDNCVGGIPQVCDPLEGVELDECDGLDNDCDGFVDEELGSTACGVGECAHSVDNCVDGIPQVCDPMAGVDLEECDGKDNDCDGLVDEKLGELECGLGECYHLVDACKDGLPNVCDPMEGAGAETCDGKDNNCNDEIDEGLGEITCGAGECEHAQPYCEGGQVTVCDPFLGAEPEQCDGLDNDCDQEVDDGLGTTTCGQGVCFHTVENCVDGAPQVCLPMEGSGAESCDGLDNDCNGLPDDGLGSTTCGLGECEHTVLNCINGEAQVCDPMAGSEAEVCDGADNNCNGEIDEDQATTTCGLGLCEHTIENCVGGIPQVCDPLEGAELEECDGFDNDCDGEADNGLEAVTCGLGICEHSVAACVDGNPQDCDPFEGVGVEVCDGLDNNCDGVVDNQDLVCEGCLGGLCGAGDVYDGSLEPGTDLKYQYSPLGAGNGYVRANWVAVSGAVSYLVAVGSAPGAEDVFAESDVGAVTSYTASGLTVEGAWSGKVYYVTVSPVGQNGVGGSKTSNGVAIAEAATWDGAATGQLNGGYNSNWPQNGATSFYGKHYFEEVSISDGTTVNVQGWGKVDGVGEGIAASSSAVTSPKDGWLELYANEMTVAGTITASGRGYGGGGGGGGGSGSVANRGRGGIGGKGGNGANGEGSYTGGGGGGSPGGVGGVGGQGKGGNGNMLGGGSGSTACGGHAGRNGGDGPVGNVGATGKTASSGLPGTGGAGEFAKGGGNGVNGCDNWTGGGGGGYGGGGSGGTQWNTGGIDAGGGGGGGSGGVGGGHTATGGKGAGPYGGSAGGANSSAGGKGGYMAASANGDSTTDRSLKLGSGGGGGGTGYQETGGGGGGAGGGWLKLYAADTLTVAATGRVVANGAGGAGGGRDNGGGSTSYPGGVGAGGGILLEAGTINIAAAGVDRISARGGDGSTAIGGTIKLFYDAFLGVKPTNTNAGRIYDAGPGSFE